MCSTVSKIRNRSSTSQYYLSFFVFSNFAITVFDRISVTVFYTNKDLN